ncbi:MAG: tetratricopeptide repeat protein [Chitinophagaceae bacterium]|nr:tetratricopeptide repeat protein [Chitinophagaceae bacterium]
MYLIACNGNEHADEILSKPPYDKLTDSIKKFKGDAALYSRRGELLYQNNQFPYAESDYKKAWTLQPNEEHAIDVAKVLIKKNQDSAITFIEKALIKIPESIVLQVSLAKGYQKRNQPEKALAICNQVISKHPNQLDALILKSEILQSLNKNDEALATLEKAYSYAPFDAEIAYDLAFEYAESQNSKALVLADSLIRMDSLKIHPEPYLLKGIYYYTKKNYDAALQQFNTAIKKDYNYLDAHMYKGEMFYDQKRYSDALKTFQLVINITPTYADAYFWMGKTLQAMGNKQEAKLNYQRAYGLDKSLTGAKEAADKL